MRFKPKHLKIVLFFLALFFIAETVVAMDAPSLYYVKYDVETENGRLASSKLHMIPVSDEFRTENFKIITVKGKSNKDSSLDQLSSAEHNAITNLLANYGLKSITNQNRIFNFHIKEKTIMSYEGVIKHPYLITDRGYIESDSEYFVEMRVAFSPIAYPDRWSVLYMKKRLRDAASAIFSIFK